MERLMDALHHRGSHGSIAMTAPLWPQRGCVSPALKYIF